MIDAKTLQTFIKSKGFDVGASDGIAGPKFYWGARATLQHYGVKEVIGWDNPRTYIAISQLFLNQTIAANLTVDGKMGPKTDSAIYSYNTKLLRTVKNNWPRQAEVRAGTSVFGAPGKNLATVTCPYVMYGDYARKIKVTSFQAHKKVAPSIERILQRTLEHYGWKKIRELNLDIFSGCYNYRKTKGSGSLSLHSWGIAVDIDGGNNALNRQDYEGAAFAKPVYDPFLDFWEDEGWVSLGRARNYDWMHFQAARF
jgi:hypothetical protein